MLPFLSIGGLNIPSYGMCIVFGIILASLWVKIDPHWKDIDFDFFILISACIFGTGFLGAKIAFILVSFPFSFQAFLSSFSVAKTLAFCYVQFFPFVCTFCRKFKRSEESFHE